MNIRTKNQLFSVEHMFALFFDSYWIFSWLFLDPFENPFSLLSAIQILRADGCFPSALFFGLLSSILILLSICDEEDNRQKRRGNTRRNNCPPNCFFSKYKRQKKNSADLKNKGSDEGYNGRYYAVIQRRIEGRSKRRHSHNEEGYRVYTHSVAGQLVQFFIVSNEDL